MNLIALLERLRATSWEWTTTSTKRAAVQLGGEVIDEVPGRTSYRLAGAADLSVYWEDESADLLEITLMLFSQPHLLSPAEYEDKIDDFFQKYEEAVREGRSILGRPTFDDGFGSDGFPDDQEAVWLALWPLPNARLMIEQKHEDKELPIRLCIVVAPPVA